MIRNASEKLTIGQAVSLDPYLEPNKQYGSATFFSTMLPFKGKDVVVRSIRTEEEYKDQFYIFGCSDPFSVYMLNYEGQCPPDDYDFCVPDNLNKGVLVAIQKINEEIKYLQQIVTNLLEEVE